MEPANRYFGGGVAEGTLHPAVLAMMLIALVAMVLVPRRYAIVPLLFSLLWIPKGQVVVLAGLHFNAFRILILAALAHRLLLAKKRPIKFTSIDRVVTLWAISLTVIYVLQWMAPQALVKSLGDLIDQLGGYWSIRYLIHDKDDLLRAIKVMAVFATVMAVFMVNEQRTGRNVFSVLGGVEAQATIRDGTIRSQGTFEHSITAAVYGATLLPLMIFLWSQRGSRLIGLLGICGSITMTITAHASTALLALVGGVGALCMWPVRRFMRLFRWGLVVTLILLHLAMKGPVWSLLEHIDLTGSSSSFHRYMLVDNLIRHFFDWWLIGNGEYGTWGWEMWDTSNQYVAYGLSGGLITLVLFITLICLAFSRTGRARQRVEWNRREAWALWCLSAAVFAHVVGFFGISYFDQVEFGWFVLLAGISAISVDGEEKLPNRGVAMRCASSRLKRLTIDLTVENR
jgi:hypothetical protein